MESLKEATWDIHLQIEKTDYAKSLLSAAPCQGSYACHLRCLAVIHHYLEEAVTRTIAQQSDTILHSLWRPERAKKNLLLQDMAHFESELYRDNTRAMGVALGLAAALRDDLDDKPERLAGWLYVLEGSTNGAKVIRRELSGSLGLREGRPGLLYLTNYADAAPKRWREFGDAMDIASGRLAPDKRDEIVEGARELFGALLELFNALSDDDAPWAYCATTFNPESGTHPVPQDEEVVRPAVRSGLRCLREFPTIRQRHGLRGERYTVADGLWLTTLAADQDLATMTQQVLWLTGLLSTRGLPSLLMERHLELLYAELMQDAPRPEWEKLLDLAGLLRTNRTAAISARDFDIGARQIWEALHDRNADLAMLLSDFGHMTMGNKADAANGLTQPEQSLEQWLEQRLSA